MSYKKTAIITGASRGIGKGVAKEFALNGANIAFTYSSSVELAKTFEKELNELGIKAIAYQSDAANYNDSIDLVDKIVEDFEKLGYLFGSDNSNKFIKGVIKSLMKKIKKIELENKRKKGKNGDN